MTVPSNVSINSHPENTAAQFRTTLAQPVEVTGDWEVALSEIYLPNNWFNVTQNECWFDVNNERFVIPEGLYPSVKAVMNKMVQLLREKHQFSNAESKEFTRALNDTILGNLRRRTRIMLCYVKPWKKVVFIIPIELEMTMSVSLMKILGFQSFGKQGIETSVAPSSVIMLAQDEPELQNLKSFMMYVYCDLVEPGLVGDTKVPLLRVVNVNKHMYEITSRIYTSPIYVPLQKKSFGTVEVNIMTDTGDPMPFASGKSVVVLHFRRTSNPYFLQRWQRRSFAAKPVVKCMKTTTSVRQVVKCLCLWDDVISAVTDSEASWETCFVV